MVNFISRIFGRDRPLESTKTYAVATPVNDKTDSLRVNRQLTEGLYYNTYEGLALGAHMCRAIIDIPVGFMGVPTPSPEDEKDQATADILSQMVSDFSPILREIHTQCHREGTVWVRPDWDEDKGKLYLELIPDDTVKRFNQDVHGEITELWTQERIIQSTGMETDVKYTRTRHFTRSTITVKYKDIDGVHSETLRDIEVSNKFGIIPIAFANMASPLKVRGTSDFQAILPSITSFHRIEVSQLHQLADFKTKLVVNVEEPLKWAEANSEGGEVPFAKMGIIPLGVDEDAKIISADRQTQDSNEKLSLLTQRILQTVNIPEIFIGVIASGNSASVEESGTTLLKNIRFKQEQKNRAYTLLFTHLLTIYRHADGDFTKATPIKMGWQELDVLSQKSKSEVLSGFLSAISKASTAGIITLEQIYAMFKAQYPTYTKMTFEEFKKGTQDMARLNQYNGLSYTEAQDYTKGSDSDA